MLIVKSWNPLTPNVAEGNAHNSPGIAAKSSIGKAKENEKKLCLYPMEFVKWRNVLAVSS